MIFSPGLVNSCFELLSLVSRRDVSFSQLRSSFTFIGVVQADTAIECCGSMRWLATGEDGLAALTPTGARLVAITVHEFRLRQAILDFIEIEEPFWLQNAAFGRRKVLDFVNSAMAQVFLEAGLVHGVSDGVVAFWDALAARARGQRDSRLLRIGRQGERLTIAYEERRTGRRPKWVSVDNSADGFDVLSVANDEDPSTLSIEVKATNIGMSATFHLTRNEWDMAVAAKLHAFHLWDMSKSLPRLAVVSPSDLGRHVPSDSGQGDWERVAIPFVAFESMMVGQGALGTGLTLMEAENDRE